MEGDPTRRTGVPVARRSRRLVVESLGRGLLSRFERDLLYLYSDGLSI
ncbi:MAG: hypothetical protein LBJ92_02890 [Holosporales bacterium]|nr:hypothetical protein [Holosporales bacterium]